MTAAEAAASADLGLLCLPGAAARGGARRARAGPTRDEPTTPELESVIGDGDDDDEKDEGRGAIAAAGNLLAPRLVQDGLAAAVGLSVGAAEAMALVVELARGKIIQERGKERERESTRLFLLLLFAR